MNDSNYLHEIGQNVSLNRNEEYGEKFITRFGTM